MREGVYFVVMDRWQTWTRLAISHETLAQLSGSCSEFLVHAVDVEGKQQGIEEPLIDLLAEGSPIPVTYAGGVRSITDIERVRIAGRSRVDFTVGSALDLFGGTGLRYRDLVQMVGPVG
jgi:phosphoribosylformimino-5-aminoimidazole carboxamide ribotide isomerase